MGEGKRRRQVDPNYGKKKFKNNISRFDSWSLVVQKTPEMLKERRE